MKDLPRVIDSEIEELMKIMKKVQKKINDYKTKVFNNRIVYYEKKS